MDSLRRRIDSFLTSLEEERSQIDLAQRRRPVLGGLYGANLDLFSIARITDVQRILAGSSGAKEKLNRALLEFLGRGRAFAAAGNQLDQRLGWEAFGSVQVQESRIPHRQIPSAFAVAADPERRHAIEEAHLEALHEQSHLPEDFLGRHREGIAELGYGSHLEGLQILGSIDLQAMAREGERFLETSRAAYLDLLRWHLPRVAGLEIDAGRASDGVRLAAASEYDSMLPGGEANRKILEVIGESGLDPHGAGHLEVEWETYLAASPGASCWTLEVPARVRLGVGARSGRSAIASFLSAYGYGLHHAYTSADLPVEQRRLGDDSVPLASAFLFESLLRTPAFLVHLYEFPRTRLPEYRSLSALCALGEIRRDVARLRFEIAYYTDGAGGAEYSELMTHATGLRHDPRAALWQIDPEFSSARRIRAAQLGARYAIALRNRFDEDWFRNPKAGAYLAELFENGRRFSAQEMAVQISSSALGYGQLYDEIMREV